MKPSVLMGIGLAFVAGMATAIMTGNALVRAQQDAAAAAARDQLAKSAKEAQAWLDKDDFLHKLNQANERIAVAVEPSVVHLQVSKMVAVQVRGQVRRRLESGSGSGWVFDQAGHIITNAHVVADEDSTGGGGRPDADGGEGPDPRRIIVHFTNGTSFEGKVVGLDTSTDIAVVSVDQNAPLVPARRAPADDSVQQGDHVYAFGSPFGFKFSMSQGIISGLSRDPSDMGSREARDTYTNYLQTDAAVNPGNSGGPLCDIHGRVVGMNVAIAADSVSLSQGVVATSRGVGFAIPLSTIEPIVDQLITHGQVSKGFLGVNMPESDDRNERALKGREYNGSGVLVTGVIVGAPAESAGLQTGDVITAINGKDVRTVSQFRTYVATKRPGEKLAVRVWRDGKTEEASVTLADLDKARQSQDAVWDALGRFGLVDLSSTAPLTILQVGDKSRAKELGLKSGTQITAVGGRAIRQFEDFIWVLAAEHFHEGKPVEVTVSTNGVARKLVFEAQVEK